MLVLKWWTPSRSCLFGIITCVSDFFYSKIFLIRNITRTRYIDDLCLLKNNHTKWWFVVFPLPLILCFLSKIKKIFLRFISLLFWCLKVVSIWYITYGIRSQELHWFKILSIFDPLLKFKVYWRYITKFIIGFIRYICTCTITSKQVKW